MDECKHEWVRNSGLMKTSCSICDQVADVDFIENLITQIEQLKRQNQWINVSEKPKEDAMRCIVDAEFPSGRSIDAAYYVEISNKFLYYNRWDELEKLEIVYGWMEYPKSLPTISDDFKNDILELTRVVKMYEEKFNMSSEQFCKKWRNGEIEDTYESNYFSAVIEELVRIKEE